MRTNRDAYNLLHSALPYKGKMDRIVIAFNSQASRK